MRYIWDRKEATFVPAHQYKRPRQKRSKVPSPQIVRDLQEPVFSHADGRFYDSKRHWRDHLKAHGMVELGNDKPEQRKQEDVFTPEAIAEAYEQCEAGKGAKLPDQPPEQWEGPVEMETDA